MRGWSLPIGKVLGVELRIHIFFLILLVLCGLYGGDVDSSAARGVGMGLMLLLAVMIREIPRAFAAAWLALPVRSLMLHPTGGLMTFAPDAAERANSIPMQRRMLFVGPIANLLAAFVFWGAIETFTPGIDLHSKIWIAPGHLLRALVWSNVFLGLMNLLPAPPLDAGRLFRAYVTQKLGLLNGMRRTIAVGQGVAFSFMVGGLLLNSVWMSLMGSLLMIGTHLDDAPVVPQSDSQTDNDTVKMRDVMMMEYSTLAASDTLVDALERSVHVLQDVFPVVRGTSMVGAVSRQSIVEALAASGNGYVQGVMTRSFQTAHPDDSLVKTLRRVMSGAGAQLLPVIEGERIVGIITPQNLAHSMGLLSRSRRLRQDA